MVTVATTPFEDLILGSQFLPVIQNKCSNSSGLTVSHSQGVLQCRHCKASFEEEQEALIHYKLHIFEIHKAHFSIVVGDLCPRGNCRFAGTGCDVIHFHCAHCSFASKEILELPLHMEEVHLPVYKEVNLCLEGKTNQLNKAYKCGECNTTVQGSITTVLHFLSHDASKQVAMEDSTMNERIHTNAICSDAMANPKSSDIKMEVDSVEIRKPICGGVLLTDRTDDNVNDVAVKDIEQNGDTFDDDVEDEEMDHKDIKICMDDLSKQENDQINNTLMADPSQQEEQNYRKCNINLTIDLSNQDKQNDHKDNLNLITDPPNQDQQTDQKDNINLMADDDQQNEQKLTEYSEGQDGSQKVVMTNPQLANLQGRVLLPLLLNSMNDKDKLNCELNPLMLLASLMEADQKSDCPIIPTQHFLLADSTENHKEEDQGYLSPASPMEGGDPSPESLLNGFRDTFNAGFVDQPPPGVFQCDQCLDAFKYQYQLTAHRKEFNHLTRQKSTVSFPFKCHICGNEFTALSDLKPHVWSHSPDYNFFCDVCGYSFTDVGQLQDHASKHSSGSSDNSLEKNLQNYERSNTCECCSTKFATKTELTLHIVKYQGTCNPDKNEGVKCATCGVVVVDLEALKKHRMTEHPTARGSSGGKRGFDCDYCGKTFSCRSNLRDHLVVHTGEKPYPCDICGKTFSFVHNMKTHRLTHNEGRNEMCPYCDRAYKSKISLYYHMKKGNCRGLSTKEVPEGFHRCTECLQMFASEERYIQHKKKGLCQISYRCEHCGVRCSTRMKLNRHIEKGLCTKLPRLQSGPKRQARESRRSTRGSRSYRSRSDDGSGGGVLCDKCNYGRDCCCTFSCKYCGKRIFSFDAYNSHRRRHCPAKKAKERLKAALRERAMKEQEEKDDADGDEKCSTRTRDGANRTSADEDSNSGSLADLTTFTAPHLLSSVSSVQET